MREGDDARASWGRTYGTWNRSSNLSVGLARGVGNELIQGEGVSGVGEIVASERLDGLLRSYRRAA